MIITSIPPEIVSLPRPIPVDLYQDLAQRTDSTNINGNAKIEFPFLGLFGEVGTLLSALKKKQRDGKAYIDYAGVVHEEVGDVLWYLSNIATRANLKFSQIAATVVAVESHSDITFNDLRTDVPSSAGEREFEDGLIVLGAEVGALFLDLKNNKASTSTALLQQLAAVLGALIKATDASGVSLEEAAYDNLNKIYNHRSPSKIRTPLFDSEEDFLEQIPRRIEMNMFDVELTPGKDEMYQQCNGVNIGSRLTDNKITPDGYRFHDVFHLAYAAILGWSPVMRALLKVKRKKKKAVDEAEDGQRAGFLEEGLSALIFQHAAGVDYFNDLEKVDYSLLKLIPSFVKGYEVQVCALWEWQEAILEGFKVFLQLRDKKRGTIIADLVERTISFKELPEKEYLKSGIADYKKCTTL